MGSTTTLKAFSLRRRAYIPASIEVLWRGVIPPAVFHQDVAAGFSLVHMGQQALSGLDQQIARATGPAIHLESGAMGDHMQVVRFQPSLAD